jgi:HSP20 family protein
MARIDLWRPRRTSAVRAPSGSGLFTEFTRMQREMDELFDRVFGDRDEGTMGLTGAGTFSPALDIVDCGKEVLVRADLPGLEQKDISVELQDGMLTVRGERKNQHEGHDDTYHWTERWEGRFVRTIPVPAGVQADRINADFKNGVLEIHIPKSEETASKKIEIKGDASAALGQGTRSGQGQSSSGQGQSSQGQTSRNATQGQSQSQNPQQAK